MAAHARFLSSHPGELLVWRLGWEAGPPDWTAVGRTLLRYPGLVHRTQTDLDNEIGELAGKVIICREGGEAAWYRTLDCAGSWAATRSPHPAHLLSNLQRFIQQPGPPTTFSFLEAVATIDGLGVVDRCDLHCSVGLTLLTLTMILSSLNSLTRQADNLKDLACEVNRRLTTDLLTKNNKQFVGNIHAVMVDFSLHYKVIKAIIEFNYYKLIQKHERLKKDKT